MHRRRGNVFAGVPTQGIIVNDQPNDTNWHQMFDESDTTESSAKLRAELAIVALDRFTNGRAIAIMVQVSSMS